MDVEVIEALEELRTYNNVHMRLAEKLFQSDEGHLHMLDLFAIATMNRSLCLLSGFVSMIEGANFVCAAPILRMQVDNCLRFYASSLVPSPGAFVVDVYKGVPIRKLNNRDGRPMTDRYLVDKLSVHIPWIDTIYHKMNGYVHLSEMHILNTWRRKPDSEQEPESGFASYEIKLSSEDEYVKTRDYVDTTKYFSASTNLVLTMIHRWLLCKEDGTSFELESFLADPANYAEGS